MSEMMAICTDADVTLESDIFDLAPVSLWLRDYSGIVSLFSRWRAAGVRSLAEYFAADTERVLECIACVRIIKVNRYTVELFDAESEADLIGPLLPLLALESLDSVATGFIRFWDGHSRYSRQTVKRSLSGRHLDVIVTGIALPGHEQSLDRVLVSVQNITGQEAAYRRLAAAERYARGLFDHSPVSLWVEDYSIIRDRMDEARAAGVRDFPAFIDANEGFIPCCIREIRIVEVNAHTLRLFRAPDVKTLLDRIGDVFRPEVHVHFRDQLIELWNGNLHQEREITNFTLEGEELTVHMQFSVFPGHEDDWALVQVALTDITARKKAEARLAFLSQRDELTKLFNRAFYVEEIGRLERARQFPISVVILDLNGLKRINDALGHGVGDGALRRMGQILTNAVLPPMHACRLGGDEFAILMPKTEEAGAIAQMERISALIDLENGRSREVALRIAAGVGTAQIGDRVEDAIRIADLRMYEAKARYYLDHGHERRQ